MKKLNFKQAVEATKEIKTCYKVGKGAIPTADRNKIEFAEPQKCGGSVFIDYCLLEKKLYLNDSRWDYVVDYKGESIFIEVHNANSKEVSVVIKKLDWLKIWLRDNAPELNKLKGSKPFYWIQSSGYHIPQNSRYERLAIQSGIKPISKLLLK